jgi:hypothetical protein
MAMVRRIKEVFRIYLSDIYQELFVSECEIYFSRLAASGDTDLGKIAK